MDVIFTESIFGREWKSVFKGWIELFMSELRQKISFSVQYAASSEEYTPETVQAAVSCVRKGNRVYGQTAKAHDNKSW